MEISKRRRPMTPVVPPRPISDIFTDDENVRMLHILRTKDGNRIITRYEASDMRMLFHYSAHVFADMADLKRFYDHTDDLTTDQAFGMLIADLKAKGIPLAIPSDPVSDPTFIATLTAAYATSPTSYPAEAPLHLRPQMAA